MILNFIPFKTQMMNKPTTRYFYLIMFSLLSEELVNKIYIEDYLKKKDYKVLHNLNVLIYCLDIQ